MYVCLCAAVTERDIEQQFEQGVDSLESLASRTGCGTVCGCCRDFATQKLDALNAESVPSALRMVAA